MNELNLFLLSLVIVSSLNLVSLQTVPVDCPDTVAILPQTTGYISCKYTYDRSVIGLYWKRGTDNNVAPFIRIDNDKRSGPGLGDYNITDNGTLVINIMAENFVGIYTFIVVKAGAGNGQDTCNVSIAEPPITTTPPKINNGSHITGPPETPGISTAVIAAVIFVVVIILIVFASIFWYMKYRPTGFNRIPQDAEMAQKEKKKGGQAELDSINITKKDEVEQFLENLRKLLRKYSFTEEIMEPFLEGLLEKNALVDVDYVTAMTECLQNGAISDRVYFENILQAVKKGKAIADYAFEAFVTNQHLITETALDKQYTMECENRTGEIVGFYICPDSIQKMQNILLEDGHLTDKTKEHWNTYRKLFGICLRHIQNENDKKKECVKRDHDIIKDLRLTQKITETQYLFHLWTMHEVGVTSYNDYMHQLINSAKNKLISKDGMFTVLGQLGITNAGFMLKNCLKEQFITPDEYVSCLIEVKDATDTHIMDELEGGAKASLIGISHMIEGLLVLCRKNPEREKAIQDFILQRLDFAMQKWLKPEDLGNSVSGLIFKKEKSSSLLFLIQGNLVVRKAVTATTFLGELKDVLEKRYVSDKEVLNYLKHWIRQEWKQLRDTKNKGSLLDFPGSKYSDVRMRVKTCVEFLQNKIAPEVQLEGYHWMFYAQIISADNFGKWVFHLYTHSKISSLDYVKVILRPPSEGEENTISNSNGSPLKVTDLLKSACAQPQTTNQGNVPDTTKGKLQKMETSELLSKIFIAYSDQTITIETYFGTLRNLRNEMNLSNGAMLEAIAKPFLEGSNTEIRLMRDEYFWYKTNAKIPYVEYMPFLESVVKCLNKHSVFLDIIIDDFKGPKEKEQFLTAVSSLKDFEIDSACIVNELLKLVEKKKITTAEFFKIIKELIENKKIDSVCIVTELLKLVEIKKKIPAEFYEIVKELIENNKMERKEVSRIVSESDLQNKQKEEILKKLQKHQVAEESAKGLLKGKQKGKPASTTKNTNNSEMDGSHSQKQHEVKIPNAQIPDAQSPLDQPVVSPPSEIRESETPASVADAQVDGPQPPKSLNEKNSAASSMENSVDQVASSEQTPLMDSESGHASYQDGSNPSQTLLPSGNERNSDETSQAGSNPNDADNGSVIN